MWVSGSSRWELQNQKGAGTCYYYGSGASLPANSWTVDQGNAPAPTLASTVTSVAQGTTTYTYNAGNRLTLITDPSSNLTTNTYDNNGNLTVSNANGTVTTNTWTYENRLRTVTAAGTIVQRLRGDFQEKRPKWPWGIDNRTIIWYSSTKIPLSIVMDMANLLKISEAASLALHAVVFLTKNCGRSLSNKEIAATLQASEAHLAKVLQRLGKVGLVEATRGPKGGFRLAKSGSEISLLQVYEAIEGPLTDTVCLLGQPVCQGHQCILGGLLETVNRQAREYLAGTTLADLTDVYGEMKDEKAQKDNQD